MFGRRRRIKAALYSPYMAGVFLPYHAAATLVIGTLAIGAAKFDRALSHKLGILWAKTITNVNFTKVKVTGEHNIKPGQSYVIMANHTSTFDILVIYGYWPTPFRWVMKSTLRNVPGLGPGCAAAGHIFVDRTNREKAIASLKQARSLLEGGISVMFFPEGKRSLSGRMLPFKKGGFMVALDMDLPILPVSIVGAQQVLPSDTYQLLPGTIEMKIHAPIETSEYGLERRDELMEAVRESIAAGLPEDQQGE